MILYIPDVYWLFCVGTGGPCGSRASFILPLKYRESTELISEISSLTALEPSDDATSSSSLLPWLNVMSVLASFCVSQSLLAHSSNNKVKQIIIFKFTFLI